MPRFRHPQTPPSLPSDTHNVNIVAAIVSSCGPSLLSRSLVGQVSRQTKATPAFSVAFACLKSKLVQVTRKNRALATENAAMKEKLIALGAKVEQYGDFIRALVDLKLDNPVKRAALAVMNGEDFETALVNAVRSASLNKDSAWSRIVPAVTGPPPGLSLVNGPSQSLQDRPFPARQNTHQPNRESISLRLKARFKFPGGQADSNNNTGLATSSALSPMCDEATQAMELMKSPNPPPVLENMLDTLKRGESWPPRHGAGQICQPQASQPLRLDIIDKDTLSDSDSILSDEVRQSLKLLPARSEDAAGPLGILKSGPSNSTTTTAEHGKGKDVAPARNVRFVPSTDNMVFMRPASIESTSSDLSYVSEIISQRAARARASANFDFDLGLPEEENEFSGSDSILSDVYADFLNATGEAEPLVYDRAPFGRSGASSSSGNASRRNSVILEEDPDYESSGSEYSDDEEDVAQSGPSGSASHQDSGAKAGSIRKGEAGRKHLPSIEEEDPRSEEHIAPQSEPVAVPKAMGSDLSVPVKEDTPAAEEMPAERLNKRYGRLELSPPPPMQVETPSQRAARRVSMELWSKATSTKLAQVIVKDKATLLPETVDIPVNKRDVDTPKQRPAQPSTLTTEARSDVREESVLREVKTNIPVTPTPISEVSSQSESQGASGRPSAKDLGKRRGVLMIAKKNILPAVMNSPASSHMRSLSKDSGSSFNSRASSHKRPGAKNHSDSSDKENEDVFSVSRGTSRAQKRTSAPIMPTCPLPELPKAPMMLSQLEHSLRRINAEPVADLSRFDSEVAELVNSMSSSDLGSLEPSDAEDEDSDSEILRAIQNDAVASTRDMAQLPHIQAIARTNGVELKSSPVPIAPTGSRRPTSTSSTSSAKSTSGPCPGPSRRLTPPKPRLALKTYTSPTKAATSDPASSTGSSGKSSSSGAESPTVARFSRTGLSRLPATKLDKLSPISSKMILPGERDLALSNLRLKQPEAGLPGSNAQPIQAPTTSLSARTPLSPLANVAGKARDVLARVGTSPSKLPAPSRLPSPPKVKTERPTAIPPPSPAQPKPWPGLNISGKISPSQLRAKNGATSPPPPPSPKPTVPLPPIPQPSTPSKSINPSKLITPSKMNSPSLLAPPSMSSSNKPRANTINTISPLPPRFNTPMTTFAPESPTKPRSNTVNSISPHGRSPLSQTVENAAGDFQSRMNHAPRVPKWLNDGAAPPSARPLGTKIAQATGQGKVTPPLQIVKKSGIPSGIPCPSKLRETKPSPVTAAFMRPAQSPPTSTPRRISTSATPLIPVWSSPDAGMSPSQARNLLRSNNVSMR